MNKMRFLAPIWFLVVAAGFSAAVMLLWNWLIPAIFGLSAISFWQALGILILSKLLFGSFRFRHGKHGGWKRCDYMLVSGLSICSEMLPNITKFYPYQELSPLFLHIPLLQFACPHPTDNNFFGYINC